jgi:hypothetical protein
VDRDARKCSLITEIREEPIHKFFAAPCFEPDIILILSSFKVIYNLTGAPTKALQSCLFIP